MSGAASMSFEQEEGRAAKGSKFGVGRAKNGSIETGADAAPKPADPRSSSPSAHNLMQDALKKQSKDVVVHGIGTLYEQSKDDQSAVEKLFSKYGEVSQVVIRHRASDVAVQRPSSPMSDDGDGDVSPAAQADGQLDGAASPRDKAQQWFSEADKDGSGVIDQQEVTTMMDKLGMHLSRKEIDAAVHHMDPSGDNKITFEEFESWYGSGRQWVNTSYAVVSYKESAGSKECLRAYAAGEMPEDLCVELFDHEKAARSAGKMNDIGKEINQAEFAEFEQSKGFQPSNVFAVLEQDAELNFLKTELVPHRVQDMLLWSVSPKNDWRMRWDMGVLVVVVWSCLTVPYSAAFKPNDSFGDWTNVVIDLIFYVDIILNFFTGYDKGYEIIMEKNKIINHYLKGWFLLDFIATVDWEVVGSWFVPDGTDLPGGVKMLALIKVTRLLRASRLIDNISADWTTDSGLLDASKFGVYVTVVAHLLACFFALSPVFAVWGPECTEDLELSARVEACIRSINGTDGTSSACGDDLSPTSGLGWYHKDQCVQMSWTQQQGLEDICMPMLCADPKPEAMSVRKVRGGDYHLNYDLRGYEDLAETCWDFDEAIVGLSRTRMSDSDELGESRLRQMTPDQEVDFLLRAWHTAREGLNPTDPRYQLAPLCQTPWRRYIDALYWSLTTMTTIGYGDRGPKTETELTYTLFAEVFGLAFFALLLTSVDNVALILQRESQQFKDDKNGVMQFLKSRGLDQGLVNGIVRFMNFRAKSLSGNAYVHGDPRFQYLSDRLQARICEAVYMKELTEVCFFGWDNKRDVEEDMVRSLFDQTDTDGSGYLDRNEILALFKKLDIELEGEHFQKCYDELDKRNNGHVSFDEFSWWWFLTKYGVPRISSGVKCPKSFLTNLCAVIQPRAYNIGERLVERGQYGENFVLLLQGKLRVKRPGVLPGQPGSGIDDPDRITKRDNIIHPTDREPIFGFSACLTKPQFEYVKLRTDLWGVDAEEYSDTLWVSRRDFYRCFTENWPLGRQDMVVWSYYHYEIGKIKNANIAMDLDHDGIVNVKEFENAQIDSHLPHGFDEFFQEEAASPGPISKPDRPPDPGAPWNPAPADLHEAATGESSSKPGVLGRSGAKLAFWDEAEEGENGAENGGGAQSPKSNGSAYDDVDTDLQLSKIGVNRLGMEFDVDFMTAHELTEASFIEEEKIMHNRLVTMETRLDVLMSELEDVNSSVTAVLRHFDVPAEETHGATNESQLKEHMSLVAQLRREITKKEARIHSLEADLAAAGLHATPEPPDEPHHKKKMHLFGGHKDKHQKKGHHKKGGGHKDGKHMKGKHK